MIPLLNLFCVLFAKSTFNQSGKFCQCSFFIGTVCNNLNLCTLANSFCQKSNYRLCIYWLFSFCADCNFAFIFLGCHYKI